MKKDNLFFAYLVGLLITLAAIGAVLVAHWLLGVIIAAIIAEGTLAYVVVALLVLMTAIPVTARLYD